MILLYPALPASTRPAASDLPVAHNIFHVNWYIPISQLFVDLGIADHVWQEKRDAIAKTVDALGDEFQPAMRACWPAYIRKTYPDGAAAAVDAIGEGTLVFDDN
jgi:hypothetical protein